MGKTNAEGIAEAFVMVVDALHKPEPAEEIMEQLHMLAIGTTAQLIEGYMLKHQGLNFLKEMALAYLLTAYNLGKQHGGLTFVVTPEDAPIFKENNAKET